MFDFIHIIFLDYNQFMQQYKYNLIYIFTQVW